MKSSFAIVFVFLFALTGLRAQTETKIIPPSPESSSVFKFLEVPVSAFTGLPNVSVPLYEIALKRLRIPIQLSYHARGIRVEEIAPRVGLGWALSYGGMISRQIRGKADDVSYGYLSQNYYNGVFTNSTLRASMANEVVNNGLDMEPDQFFYDMNGMSGKFVFDQVDKQILQQKFSDVTITKIMGEDGIEGWVTVDDQGNKFYYGLSKDGMREAVDYDELINSYSFSWLNGLAVLGNDGDTRNVNTWHLMEIETPFNETVTFFYEEEVSSLYRRSYDKKTGSDVVCYFSHTNAHQQQIERIEFNNGKVIFSESGTVREDLEGAYVLNNVGIYTDTNELIKEYLFQYHYTTSPAGDNNQLNYLKTIEPKAAKRLFLSSVQERGQAAKTIPPYNFEYNPTLLPNRFSNSQDIWGYYNGKPNGSYLTFFQYSNDPVDRGVDVSLSEAGILKKMTYPTGGDVSFTYEHNVAEVPPFMSEIMYPLTISTEEVPVLDGFLKNSEYYAGGIYSKEIAIGPEKTDDDVIFTIDLPFCPGPFEDDPSYCQYEVWLRGSGVDLYLYPWPQRTRSLDLSPGTYTLEVHPPSGHDPGLIDNLFHVKLEWNEVVTTTEGGPPPVGEPQILMAAGKRIKKIEYKNEDATASTKEYTYFNGTYLGGGGATSGKIFGLPNFYYKIDSLTFNGNPAVDPYGSLPGSPLTSLQGNSVGYSHVTEYQGDGNVNIGKTEYEFTTPYDGGDYYTFPFHLPVDNEWLRGKNLSTSYYEKSVSGTYSLKKKIENTYLYAGTSTTPDPLMTFPVPAPTSPFVYSKTRTHFYLPLLIHTDDAGGFKVFYLTGGTFDLQSTTETDYELDAPKLAKQTNFYYDYPRHYQQHSSEIIASDGSKEINITSYASSYPVGTAFIDGMKTWNLLSYPIEQVVYREVSGIRSILSGKITKYRSDNPALADQVMSLEISNPLSLASFKFSNRATGVLPPTGTATVFSPHGSYKPVLNFDQYDAKGNILKYTKTNDIEISYLWDYKSQYPIAEAKNTSYNDIAYTSFEADGKGNWSFAGATIPDNTSPTGKRAYDLAEGQITKTLLNTAQKYLLTYWAKSATSPGVSGSSGSLVSSAEVLTTINGWSQFGREVSNASSLTISGSVSIDEIRLHPVTARMTTYTYDPLIGMTSVTDENGKTTYYKYDELNRLESTEDKEGNLLKQYQYNYAQD